MKTGEMKNERIQDSMQFKKLPNEAKITLKSTPEMKWDISRYTPKNFSSNVGFQIQNYPEIYDFGWPHDQKLFNACIFEHILKIFVKK